ncbi:MAG: hypothetical protein GY698_06550 [Actinomycetia bacterium]|nr:hypothetical protein [Actinomycetes bacterium]
MLTRPAAPRRLRFALPRRFRHSWVPRALMGVSLLFLLTPLVTPSGGPGGTVERVPVLVGPVPARTLIDPADVRWEIRRVADLPDTPIAASPEGARTLVDLAPGEVITQSRLAPNGPGPGSTLDPSERAVAIPLDAVRPPLVAGATVDVVATFALGEQAMTETVAAGAVVLETTEQAVTVVVPAHLAATVIEFLATGVVKVVLAPPT